MILKKKQMKLSEIRKILTKRGFEISKTKKNLIFNKNLKSFYYTIIAGLFFISFFYFLPKSIILSKKIFYIPVTIENKSKINFNNTLLGKKTNQNLKIDRELDNKHLFDDINDFEKVTEDTVRLSASTLEQLFLDTKYNLKEVRKTKIVKPVSIDLLPTEIKKIENTKKRKEFFIQIILPIILEENNRIKIDRKRLFVILNKNSNSKSEMKWLNKKFKQYGVLNQDISTLKVRMDEVPVSLTIAQAAKETGWGTSRFAIEGNALFGQWTWSNDGIRPSNADSDSSHKVMKFKVLKASVRAYQRNLNTHSSYREFRKIRSMQRDNHEKLNSLELVSYLDKYAETGKEYTKVLKKIIEQNSLTDFDDAKMLPKSVKIKNLI